MTVDMCDCATARSYRIVAPSALNLRRTKIIKKNHDEILSRPCKGRQALLILRQDANYHPSDYRWRAAHDPGTQENIGKNS